MLKARPHVHLSEDRDGFRFRGGHNAIDLPATLQARLKPVPRELLKTPDDLARWLVSAGLVRKAPATNGADLATARNLREAIYAMADGLVSGASDVPGARAVINDIAAGASAIPRLSPRRDVQMIGGATELLVTLARQAVHLFGSEAADHIRQCQSPTCTLFFVDTSRSGQRRWCSMSGCGNKAKVAEFRRRRSEVGTKT